MPCFVYENKGTDNRYLKFKLTGEGGNTLAIGSKITVRTADNTWTSENQPTRGFQSSMDPAVVIGVGAAKQVDVEVRWPNGKVTRQNGVSTNQTLALKMADAQPAPPAVASTAAKFELLPNLLSYVHRENPYVDFNRERLKYHAHSTLGPRVATGDVNGDGIADMVVPGPKGMDCRVLIGSASGAFTERPIAAVPADAEHVAALLFDADGDGDQDLYLASGGVEITEFSGILQDQLLFNDGQGNFSNPRQLFPNDRKMSTMAVAAGDVDGDGDLDLFVGERIKIGQYGAPCSGFILLNDGKGSFTDATARYYPGLSDIGMITDARWADLNADGKTDLVVIGELMEVHILLNDGKKLTRTELPFPNAGWWNTLHICDVDGDKKPDIVLGNMGTNSRFDASADHPLRLYFSDFDQNGVFESVLTFNAPDGKDYPYALRHNLAAQMPYLKKRYPDFATFKTADISQIFDAPQLADATVHTANELHSVWLRNLGGGKFEKHVLPVSAQVSPVYAITSADVDASGTLDLILGGNLRQVQPEVGMYDASYGHCLLNSGTGTFIDRAPALGLSIPGEIRDLRILNGQLFVFRNNAPALAYRLPKG
jgi:hypothetical protein